MSHKEEISPQVTYKINVPLSAKELASVFKNSGIKRPINDLQRLQKMIEHADLLITAWEEKQLIGVARAITDYSYCCYLSDLAVDKRFQGNGIGKELVRLVQEEISEKVALILLASNEALEYYPRIGFEKIENGFIIARKS